MMLVPFERSNSDHIERIASIWNHACDADLAITPGFVEFNARLSAGGVQDGRLAVEDGEFVGFVLASVLLDDEQASPRESGWVDAIAVVPSAARHGVGGALLAWAESWLRGQGCTQARLGGSLRPFAAGLPASLASEPFFKQCGYIRRPASPVVWDVARDLADYRPQASAKHIDSSQALVRRAQEVDSKALAAFLRREFPGRWRFEFQEFLRQNGRISDYCLLVTRRGVDGFCHLTFEDSLYPMNRFYPHRLPRPWGQVGPIGVSADCRGAGYGTMLLDASLLLLQASGVRGCVIDWTDLVGFYRRFGFEPLREYAVLVKQL